MLDKEEDLKFWAGSIYGAKLKRGMVELSFVGKKLLVTPSEARAIAGNLIECAESAETDEMLMEWCQLGGMTEEQAARALVQFRTIREGRREKHEIKDLVRE